MNEMRKQIAFIVYKGQNPLATDYHWDNDHSWVRRACLEVADRVLNYVNSQGYVSAQERVGQGGSLEIYMCSECGLEFAFEVLEKIEHGLNQGRKLRPLSELKEHKCKEFLWVMVEVLDKYERG